MATRGSTKFLAQLHKYPGAGKLLTEFPGAGSCERAIFPITVLQAKAPDRRVKIYGQMLRGREKFTIKYPGTGISFEQVPKSVQRGCSG